MPKKKDDEKNKPAEAPESTPSPELVEKPAPPPPKTEAEHRSDHPLEAHHPPHHHAPGEHCSHEYPEWPPPPPPGVWPRHRGRFSTWRAIKRPLIFILLILLCGLIYQLKDILVCLAIAITLASAIAPIAQWMEEKAKVSRVLTIFIIYALTGILYSILVVSLYPTIREQALSLYDSIPQYTGSVMDLYIRARELLGESVSGLSLTSIDAKAFMAKISAQALKFTQNLVSIVVSGILVLFLTAYFVVEAKDIWSKVLDWVPKANRPRMASLIKPLEIRLGGYVRGQLLVSLAVASFLTTGMYFIGVDHAILLGSLSGLLNLVPFVGSMITCVLALLVSFNQSLTTGLLCLGLFAVEQWLESNFIVPTLLGKQVELHPLVVLFAILAGANLLGLPGALIAVPLATVGMFLAEEFYLRPLKEREAKEDNKEVTTDGAAEETAI